MSDSNQEVFNEGEWSKDARADIFAVLAVVTLVVSSAVMWVASH